MKYLHSVLTVIAICLVLICCALLGFIPKANAGNGPNRYISVPINPDGSITVRVAKGTTIDVNIDEIGGESQTSSTIDVNVDEVSGHNTHGSVPVEVSR